MKNNKKKVAKTPADFLGVKVLNPLQEKKVVGGGSHHHDGRHHHDAPCLEAEESL